MNATLTDAANWLASIGFKKDGWITNEVDRACQAGGCYRSVWLFDDWAIKFARKNPDNQDEWNVYHDMPEEVRALMAKPLAISDNGNVLIMERMQETLRQREHDRDTRTILAAEFDAILRDALIDYAGFSLHQCDQITNDNHNNNNIAFDKAGNLRWIDYSIDILQEEDN